VGATLHTIADRRGPAVPPRGRQPWLADETYVKVAGVGRYVYRAVDQHGQVIDVYVSARRDITSAPRFFTPR
jgi:transposase-like protein